ncbi:prephenate dehydratase [Rarobacter faecitabidus]|uniref:Prephenate dehydratase n=1 Tax=Rarobacter faecitabidus TaxID=13243 RepID=A0A542ZUM3_RARFA|nr:prephenate dehydratase domain-containing protein [Rarobacter faecitabidus]TQL64037.1 prephenate dehydratase/chorismate mutase/prephenate dehydratase [Rarobacter faecitabidus]
MIGYLGPEGSFTYAAALAWSDRERLRAFDSVSSITATVGAGDISGGVIAIENSVEGYVAQSLDALIAADDVVAVDQIELPITFDAFTLPGASDLRSISAHPHGLAQCRDFVASRSLPVIAASSNAAACRDLGPHGIALGPRVCGDLYGLTTLAREVQDFAGARTRFLRLARRDLASKILRGGDAPDRRGEAGHGDTVDEWSTMVALTPTVAGPGVLARIAAAFGRRGVNMSSLVTRPLKAVSGRYVFVITCDGAPWQDHLRALFEELLAAGDSLKTLGVFPHADDLDAMVDPNRIPAGSASDEQSPASKARALLW